MTQSFDPSIALVLTPIDDINLKHASQIGVTDIAVRYPGLELSDLLALCDRVADAGLRVSVVEGYIPHNHIVHGTPGRDEQLENFKRLIRNMAKASIPICCYNFMPDDDWSRTAVDTPERGGALVTSFDQAQVPERSELPPISEDRLWENYEVFLREIVPVAEEEGVRLALHPDDPPVSPLRGQDRIMITPDAFERAMSIVPSPANTVCFCQGSFAQMGVDVPATIRRLGSHISYVHFRDVVGTVPSFRETFHDNGKTDMVAAMEAYRSIGFKGPMRPDHVPVMEGESLENAGYTMLGRIFAVGYMRGLIQAVSR